MDHNKVINSFYTSFSKGDYKNMIACYHEDIVFTDPAFGEIHGERACKMWEMLLKKANGKLKIEFQNVESNENTGGAQWTANYIYGPKERKVTNIVQAKFTFKEGKIIKHTDSFDMWKWSQQALGPIGLLLGWTPIIKNKVQKTVNLQLDKFIAEE